MRMLGYKYVCKCMCTVCYVCIYGKQTYVLCYDMYVCMHAMLRMAFVQCKV